MIPQVLQRTQIAKQRNQRHHLHIPFPQCVSFLNHSTLSEQTWSPLPPACIVWWWCTHKVPANLFLQNSQTLKTILKMYKFNTLYAHFYVIHVHLLPQLRWQDVAIFMIMSLKVSRYYLTVILKARELLAIQSDRSKFTHFSLTGQNSHTLLNGTHIWLDKLARTGSIYQWGTIWKRNMTHLWLDKLARTGFINQGLASDRVGTKQRRRPFLHYMGRVWS